MTSKTTPEAQNNVDMEVFFSLVFAEKKLILLSLLVTVAAALVYSVVAPRTYESTVKILAEPQKEDNPYKIELRSKQDWEYFLETQKEMVVSNAVLAKTIAVVEEVPEQSVTPEQIDDFSRQVKVVSRSGLGKNIFSGTGIGQSYVFFVTVSGRSAEKAATSANKLVESYMQVSDRVKREQAESALSMLQSSVDESNKRVQEAHARLVDFERQTGALLPELMSIDKPSVRVFPELSDLRARYEMQKADIAKSRATVDALDTMLAQGGKPAIQPELMESFPVLKSMSERIGQLRLELNELRPYFTDDSREVASLTEQITLSESTMREELKKIATGARQSLASLEASQKALEDVLADYEGKLARLSAENSRHAELKRDYQAQSKALESQIEGLAKAEIASAERTSSNANIAILDWGSADSRPVSPQLVCNVMWSIPFGLGLGILMVLLAQMTHPIYVHPRQLEKSAGVPVVAVMPQLKG